MTNSVEDCTVKETVILFKNYQRAEVLFFFLKLLLYEKILDTGLL